MSRLIEKASVQSRFFLPDIFFGSILNVFREPEKLEDKRGFYGKKNICNPGNVRHDPDGSHDGLCRRMP